MKLPPKEVALWRVDLDDARWDALEWLLDSGERIKAMQFHTDQLRWRSRRCRSALRCILSHHTSLSPSGLKLAANRFGKPELAGNRAHFNVAHTEGWALIAVATEPVGVDLERALRPAIAIEEIAALACHPSETASLLALASSTGNAAMMRLWTQKEAYVKALGTGLQHVLAAVRLAPAAGGACALVVDDSAGAMTQYFVYEVEAPPQCVASLCIAAPDAAIRSRDASILLQMAIGRQQA